MNVFDKLKNNKYWLINYALCQFLIHIVYFTTFVSNIEGQYELAKQLKNNNLTNQIYWNESPVFFILFRFIGIETFNSYLLFIYLISQILILCICLKMNFFSNYSILFFLSGWVLTTSWWMGYPDLVSVLITVLIYKNKYYNKDKHLILIFVYSAFLAFNHYAIGFFVVINLILLNRKNQKSYALTLLSGLIFGYSLLQIYLNLINFNGESRLIFLTRSGLLGDMISQNSSNFIEIILSSFLGVLIFYFYISIYETSETNLRSIFSTIVTLAACSISLDASRTFSIICIPIILDTIYRLKKRDFFMEPLRNLYILFSLISVLVFKNFYVWEGTIYNQSPFRDYDFFYSQIVFYINTYLKPLL